MGAEIYPHKVYFSIKVKERNLTTVRVVCVDPDQCCIMDEHPEINSSVISLEAVVQPLPAGGGRNE